MFISKANSNGQKFPTWIDEPKWFLMNFFLKNNKHIEFIKKCFFDKVNFISVTINFIITSSHISDSEIYISNTLHASNIVINLTDPNSIKLLSLESSITGGKKYLIFENTYGKELEKIFNQIFNKNITYISFIKDACPMFNIQDSGGTCIYWSIYLFYTYMLNDGNRTKIYRILQKVDIKYRNRILSQFIYFIYRKIVVPRKC